MIADMIKIQIATSAKKRDELLRHLQEEEVVQIIEPKHVERSEKLKESKTPYRLAHIQFALEFLARIRKELHRSQKKNWRNIFAQKPVADLIELEQIISSLNLDNLLADIRKSSNKLAELIAEEQEIREKAASLEPFTKLALRGADLSTKAPIIHKLVIITTRDEALIQRKIREIPTAEWQEVLKDINKNVITLYGELIVHKKHLKKLSSFMEFADIEEVECSLREHESIKSRYTTLQQQLAKNKREYLRILKRSSKHLKIEKQLQCAYDALLHRQERESALERMAHLPHTTILTGWIPSAWYAAFAKKLEEMFPAAALDTVSVKKDEIPPVALLNKKYIQPFESVTNIYGKPAYHELDPSSALALFFLVSFGLALTDAGYGIVMMLVMWAAEKFMRLKREMRNMVRLLFYAGAATTIIGALTGGWFGITLENLPENVASRFLVSLKLIDPLSQLLTLLGIALLIGVVQLIFAWIVRGYHNWKSNRKLEVFLDDIPWITIVIFSLAWTAAGRGILPHALQGLFGWLALINAGFLVLTQGRTYKNPLLKIGVGTLSLYGLVSFVSDTLSYSRLLALGLATGIIGLVVNLIASMISSSVPYVGIILAGIVLVIGHTFNLGINALGAFIHAGRLQFVEFFPKFMEGGGAVFKPFGRVSKYVDNPNEFS